MNALIRIAETGYIPDAVLRMGIKRLLRKRLKNEARRSDPGLSVADGAGGSPIAIATDKANEQHYELPPDFFELMLGPRLKYSCCHWSFADQGLAVAEEEMLALTCERAGIRDGMRVLDLGSGWGSLGLWIAGRFPACRVTTVSNSEPQRRFIRDRAAASGSSVTTCSNR